MSKVTVHLYGKEYGNLSLGGFNVNGISTEAVQRQIPIQKILNSEEFSGINKFLAPHPGAAGALADLSDMSEVSRFPYLMRGAKGDVIEISPKEAYVVSAADCLVGYVMIGEKVFAFHAGWQELRGVLAVLVEQIDKYGNDKTLVRAKFGFGMEQEYLSLEQSEDSPNEVQHVLDLSRSAGGLEMRDGKNFICLQTTMVNVLKQHCGLELEKIPSNTINRNKWWSNRLDGKDETGANQSNLAVIARHK